MPWKKNFDVDDTLRKAGEAFWTHGYEATSMQTLLEAMGIQKGSFYDTYGSKRDAYLRSLEQYLDERFGAFETLAEGLSSREGLEAQLAAIRDECLGAEGHRGCMIANCALELAHDDVAAQRIVQRGFERHRALLASQLRGAQAEGQVSATLDADALGTAILGLVLGMRSFARSGAPAAAIHTLHDQALELLER